MRGLYCIVHAAMYGLSDYFLGDAPGCPACSAAKGGPAPRRLRRAKALAEDFGRRYAVHAAYGPDMEDEYDENGGLHERDERKS